MNRSYTCDLLDKVARIASCFTSVSRLENKPPLCADTTGPFDNADTTIPASDIAAF